jgi:hypothetical protein
MGSFMSILSACLGEKTNEINTKTYLNLQFHERDQESDDQVKALADRDKVLAEKTDELLNRERELAEKMEKVKVEAI